MGWDAFAQAGAAAEPVNPTIGMLVQMGPFLAIFAVMYFLMIRPQQQRQKQVETMLKALKRDDRVLTTGGLYGTVIDVHESRVVVKIAEGTKVEFAKSAIVQVVGAETR